MESSADLCLIRGSVLCHMCRQKSHCNHTSAIPGFVLGSSQWTNSGCWEKLVQRTFLCTQACVNAAFLPSSFPLLPPPPQASNLVIFLPLRLQGAAFSAIGGWEERVSDGGLCDGRSVANPRVPLPSSDSWLALESLGLPGIGGGQCLPPLKVRGSFSVNLWVAAWQVKVPRKYWGELLPGGVVLQFHVSPWEAMAGSHATGELYQSRCMCLVASS